ncbi:MOSC domain-containing protein [Streptantibioticus silvisoli]|uniref:MOSC domain-containing protein n=1 Tax=Streptantibioticus silvisoli TaxID=2705255 RepID=A0ABT6W2Y4_9ACTN|nr:MOSC domain-containing protein [Streptantibioticus silvisoli]MDI5965107.1 MOSC domain-containing protein [Streptantibioticus silvisoli]
MSRILSVNVGTSMVTDYSDAGSTGIDKRPVDGPVRVEAPGERAFGEVGGSGLAGDAISDRRFHGGNAQAVYAYAREELDGWERELGRPLSNGMFGENLTTSGVVVSDALIGERWRVGDGLVLEVTSCRIPCRTFAEWLGERGWVKRFTQAALPGAYLRVITPGEVCGGDAVEVVSRPAHDVTVSVLFRAMTTEPALLRRTLAASGTLNPDHLDAVLRRLTRT